jgi:hypothetical protein
MNKTNLHIFAAAAAMGAAGAAHGQFAISWYSIDGGGTTVPITGGSFSLAGTIGQPDAGKLTGGAFELLGGFWGGAGGATHCYANCDASTVSPILNVDDFTCFINAFALGQSLPPPLQQPHYANCDGSTTAPVLNVDDFTCFINAYALGCP